MADQGSLNDSLLRDVDALLAENQVTAQEQVRRLRIARAHLGREPDLDKHTFRVTAMGLMEDEGEKTIVIQKQGRLEDLIHEVKDEFKRANNRADFQARYLVQMLFPVAKGAFYEISIPKGHWSRFL